jgi:hypothetical protein
MSTCLLCILNIYDISLPNSLFISGFSHFQAISDWNQTVLEACKKHNVACKKRIVACKKRIVTGEKRIVTGEKRNVACKKRSVSQRAGIVS